MHQLENDEYEQDNCEGNNRRDQCHNSDNLPG